MPDAAPDLNDTLNQIVQGLLAPSNAPVPRAQPVDTDSTKPTSWTGLLGEALAGGPPADVQLTKAQREAAGARSLINFGIGMMGVGPFDSFGQGLAAGLTRAQESQYGAEGLAAQRQVDVQDWQQQQLQNRFEALKQAVPLLQLQGRMNLPNPFAQGPGGPGGGGGGAIPGTAPGTAIPATYEGQIAGREGTARNPRSTAFGVGQFLESTWNAFAQANPDLFKGMTPDQILAARSNPAIANQAITWLAQQNANTLQARGITPSGQSLGLAHYLGAGPAAQVMGAPDSDPVSKYVSDAAVRANPELASMTVGQLKQRYANTPDPSFLTAQQPPAAQPATGPLAPVRVAGPGAPTAPPGGTPAAPAGGLTPPLQRAIGPEADPLVADPDTGELMPRSIYQGRAAPAPTAQQTGDLTGPRPLPQVGPGTPVVTPSSLANTPVPAAPAPTAPAAAQPPPQGPPAPTTPAAQPQPPGQPSATGDEALTWPQFRQKYAIPAPSVVQQSWTAGPDQARMQDLQQNLAAAQQQYVVAQRTGGDLAKASQAVTTATKAIADLQEQAAEKGNQLRQDWETKQDERLAPLYQGIQERAAARRNIQVTSDVAAGQKSLEEVNNTRDGARDTINNLQIAKEFSKTAGQPDFLTNWPETANLLVRNNLLTPDEVQRLGAQRGLDQVMNKVVSSMRQSAGFSRITNFDLQFLQSTAPNSFTPEQMRPAMFATIQSAAQRQLDFANLVNDYHASGIPVWQAKEMADAKLGKLVKDVPTANTDGSPMSHADQNAWILRNVTPGTFYIRAPLPGERYGRLAIRGE